MEVPTILIGLDRLDLFTAAATAAAVGTLESISHESIKMRLYRISIMSAAGDRLINVVNTVSGEYLAVLLRESTNNAVVCTACDHEYLRLGTYVSELHFAFLHTAGVNHEAVLTWCDTGSRASTAYITEYIGTHKSAVDSLTAAH